jgi:hypothetical protein
MSNQRISSAYALIVCCSALVRSRMADCASNNVLTGGSAPPTTRACTGKDLRWFCTTMQRPLRILRRTRIRAM